jgi:hypothetical protein
MKTLALVLATFFLPLAGEAVDRSLILYFPFNEVKGDEVSDLSGNNFAGTLTGGVEWTGDGKYNGALSFDGSTGHVVVEYNKELDLTGSFTVMAWAYATIVDGGFRWIADKTHDNDDLNYLLGISSNNQLRFITRKLSNDVYSGFVVTTEKWYHIAGVQDSQKKEVILYVDGAAIGSEPLAGEKTVNDADLKIGCREWQGGVTQFFGGIIDEVAIFTRALTEAEIKAASEGVEKFLDVTPSSLLAITWGELKIK